MIISNRPRIYDIDLYGAALVVGICLITWYGLLRPLDARSADKRRQQVDASQRQGTAETELASMQSRFERQNALALRLARMPDILGACKGLDDVIGRVDILSRQYGVSLDEVKPGDPTRSEHSKRMPVDIKLKGEFRQAMQLLSNVTEKMPYLRIDSMNVNKSYKFSSNCDIGLTLHVFAR